MVASFADQLAWPCEMVYVKANMLVEWIFTGTLKTFLIFKWDNVKTFQVLKGNVVKEFLFWLKIQWLKNYTLSNYELQLIFTVVIT